MDLQHCNAHHVWYQGEFCPCCIRDKVIREAGINLNFIPGIGMDISETEKVLQDSFIALDVAAKLIKRSKSTLSQWKCHGTYPDLKFTKQGNRTGIDNRDHHFKYWAIAHGFKIHELTTEEVIAS